VVFFGDRVVEILTDNNRPRKYWNDLKKKLSEEGSEVSEKIGQLKMQNLQESFVTKVTAGQNRVDAQRFTSSNPPGSEQNSSQRVRRFPFKTFMVHIVPFIQLSRLKKTVNLCG